MFEYVTILNEYLLESSRVCEKNKAVLWEPRLGWRAVNR